MTTASNVPAILRSLEEEMHIAASGPMIVREHPSREDARIAFFEGACRDVSQQYDGKPVIRYIGSDNSEDRHVSILNQGKKAVQVEAYLRNPVFAWAHQYGIPVIGNTVGLDLQKDRTVFDVEFLLDAWDLPNTANLARLVYRLVKDNRMPGSSVGFIPLKEEAYDIAEAKMPVPWFMTPTRFIEWELLELSSVPIPSNRGALKKALDDHAISENEIDFLGLGKFMREPALILSSLPRAHVTMAAAPAIPNADAKEVLTILKACGDVKAATTFLETFAKMTPEQRKGAVLNRRNANRLMDATEQLGAAADLIGEVLDEAGYSDGDEPVTPKASPPVDDATLRTSLDSLASDVQTLSQQMGIEGAAPKGNEADPKPKAGADDGQGDDVLTQLTAVRNLAGTILDFRN